jgi:tetratricopeptide (TPR) repeat protein
MPEKYVCLICYHEIPHAGAECPHCKSRVSSTVGSTPQMLFSIFAVMILLFVVTGFYNGAFRAERRARAEEHARMARTLFDYGYYRQAIEHFREALTFSRDDVDYQLGLAQSLYNLGRYREAQNRLLDLRAVNPTLAVVNRLLARIAAREGSIDEAVGYYRTAIYSQWQRDPDENRLATRFELVELLEANGLHMRAIGELLDVMEEAPARPDTQKRIGALFLQAGAPDRASEVFESIVRRQPNDIDALLGYGQAEFEQGDFTAARETFARALRLAPGNTEARERLELTEEINRLDPTRRGISMANRYRRSRALVERAAAVLEACLNPLGAKLVGPPSPPPDDIRPLLEQARALEREGARARPSDESIDANIALAENLWQARGPLCPDFETPDQALDHVLEMLSR